MFHHLSFAQYSPILFISFLGMPTNPLVSVLCFPACNSRTWYKLPLCPLWFWDSIISQVFPRLSLNLPCLICQMLHSQQYSMRCLRLTSPSLYNPFLLAILAATFSFLAFCTATSSPASISRLSFSSGGLSPINDVFISPAVSNYSKLQGKFMPTFFVLSNLYTFMLLRSSLSSLILMKYTLLSL